MHANRVFARSKRSGVPQMLPTTSPNPEVFMGNANLLLLLLLLALVGCGSGQPSGAPSSVDLQASVPSPTPIDALFPLDGAGPEVRGLMEAFRPRLFSACPGLSLYASDLSHVGFESNLSYAPPHAQRVEVVLQVAENPSTIPGRYRAAGHRCFFGVSPDGATLLIGKGTCAMLCKDSTDADRGDFAEPL